MRHGKRLPQDQTLVYCDPPYYERAKRLYPNWYEQEDHARLARFIQAGLHHPWLVSYDANPAVSALYAKRRTFTYPLQYSATRSYVGTEQFIFSDGLVIPERSAVAPVNQGLETASFGT
jgi:DNA adenine methylase